MKLRILKKKNQVDVFYLEKLRILLVDLNLQYYIALRSNYIFMYVQHNMCVHMYVQKLYPTKVY